MPILPPQPIVYEITVAPWLRELGVSEGRTVTLGDVPDRVWNRLASLGVHAVWLMGVWERSPEGRRIALEDAALGAEFRRALPDVTDEDVIGSPYCIRRYRVDVRFGGPEGLARARAALARRGLSLVLDFVPNHVARDHAWVARHPDWFVGGSDEDLAGEPRGFFRAGDRVMACGRDPYFPAWTDVAQLNAFSSGMRAASIDTLCGIADQADGVRCDMAMLVMNEVFARTWGSRAGTPADDEFWPTITGAVRAHAPAFRFIAEAYWDLEAALQQQGFDFCYDKRLYDRLCHDGAGSVYEHLQAGREYQKRLIRFVENHDEPRSAGALGPPRARAPAALVLAAPGATLLYDGQLEGRRVRLPVQLARAPDEPVDVEASSFYDRVLGDARSPVCRDGQWWLCGRCGWVGDERWRALVPLARQSGDDRRLVVVNLADHPSAGRVVLPWLDLDGTTWRLTDVVTGAVYDRDGTALLMDGLYVELPPWGVHWFRWERLF